MQLVTIVATTVISIAIKCYMRSLPDPTPEAVCCIWICIRVLCLGF